jgi:hypothetical protein
MMELIPVLTIEKKEAAHRLHHSTAGRGRRNLMHGIKDSQELPT